MLPRLKSLNQINDFHMRMPELSRANIHQPRPRAASLMSPEYTELNVQFVFEQLRSSGRSDPRSTWTLGQFGHWYQGNLRKLATQATGTDASQTIFGDIERPHKTNFPLQIFRLETKKISSWWIMYRGFTSPLNLDP